ncbi:MAG: ECF transporter S component [Enterococcus sp.]
MNKKQTNKLTIYAMLIALTVALSLTVIIPVPATNGFVTLCDVGIYLAALLFGPIGGLTVGAFSGGLIDLLSGYPEWAIFSLLIHGLQGFIVGYIANKPMKYSRLLALFLGSLTMIVGYVFAGSLLFSWPTGIASIPGNVIQTGFGSLVTVPLFNALTRALPKLQNKI